MADQNPIEQMMPGLNIFGAAGSALDRMNQQNQRSDPAVLARQSHTLLMQRLQAAHDQAMASGDRGRAAEFADMLAHGGVIGGGLAPAPVPRRVSPAQATSRNALANYGQAQ